MYRQADTHTKDLTLGAILSTSPDIRLYPGKKEKQTVIYTVSSQDRKAQSPLQIDVPQHIHTDQGTSLPDPHQPRDVHQTLVAA